MILPVLLMAMAQTPSSAQHRLFLQPNLPHGGASYAFFEFAPSNGVGMGAPCACTTPSGVHGEAMTFTRASSGTCLKGSTVTGIANGDMVTCSTDQPRVMPGGDGTGVLGLLVESERTNLALRSEALNNAVWTASNAGASVAPTVTADFAVAPDGATTAERVQFSACANAGADASILYQISLGTTGSNYGSIFCKGTSASQTISICIADGGGANDVCSPVTCTNTSWTRISMSASVTTSGGMVLGCNNLTGVYSGASSTGAADVLLWGGQYEAGAFPSSYIATAGATATRAAETAYITLASSPQAGGPYSAAATLTVGALSTETWFGWQNYTAAASPGNRLFNVPPTLYCETTNATDVRDTRAAVGSLTSPTRFVCYNDGDKEYGLYAGAAFGSPTSGTRTAALATRFDLGSSNGTGHIFGVINQVCLDPSPSRCR